METTRLEPIGEPSSRCSSTVDVPLRRCIQGGSPSIVDAPLKREAIMTRHVFADIHLSVLRHWREARRSSYPAIRS